MVAVAQHPRAGGLPPTQPNIHHHTPHKVCNATDGNALCSTAPNSARPHIMTPHPIHHGAAAKTSNAGIHRTRMGPRALARQSESQHALRQRQERPETWEASVLEAPTPGSNKPTSVSEMRRGAICRHRRCEGSLRGCASHFHTTRGAVTGATTKQTGRAGAIKRRSRRPDLASMLRRVQRRWWSSPARRDAVGKSRACNGGGTTRNKALSWLRPCGRRPRTRSNFASHAPTSSSFCCWSTFAMCQRMCQDTSSAIRHEANLEFPELTPVTPQREGGFV